MKTNKITSALRKSNLPEDKYLKRKHVQCGWYFDNDKILCNSYDKRNDALQIKWATKVMEVISAAGFESEIVYQKQGWGMPTLINPMIMGIRITGEAAK